MDDDTARRFARALELLGIDPRELARHAGGITDEDELDPNPNATELRSIRDNARKHEDLNRLLYRQMNEPKEDE